MTTIENRKTNFDRAIRDYDEKALEKCVNFVEHRFLSIERDKFTINRYVKGHKTLRGACGYLSRAVMDGEPYVPELVLNLDTGESHELSLIAFVAPKSVDAVGVMLPRFMALQLRNALQGNAELEQTLKILDRALERRS